MCTICILVLYSPTNVSRQIRPCEAVYHKMISGQLSATVEVNYCTHDHRDNTPDKAII